jgi:hypothetical protein
MLLPLNVEDVHSPGFLMAGTQLVDELFELHPSLYSACLNIFTSVKRMKPPGLDVMAHTCNPS